MLGQVHGVAKSLLPCMGLQGLAKGQALAEGLPTGTALIGLLCSVDLLVLNEMSSK